MDQRDGFVARVDRRCAADDQRTCLADIAAGGDQRVAPDVAGAKGQRAAGVESGVAGGAGAAVQHAGGGARVEAAGRAAGAEAGGLKDGRAGRQGHVKRVDVVQRGGAAGGADGAAEIVAVVDQRDGFVAHVDRRCAADNQRTCLADIAAGGDQRVAVDGGGAQAEGAGVGVQTAEMPGQIGGAGGVNGQSARDAVGASGCADQTADGAPQRGVCAE